jgi:SAM-dependent methyltransferase
MTPPRTPPEPVPSDYDENPGRMRLARSVLRRHAVAGDVHELVARRFIAEGFARVLDVGCGEGELARYLPNGAWVGLDNSQTMLAWAPAGGVRGEATAPFRSRTGPSTASRSSTSSTTSPIPVSPSQKPTA